jgi:hypothetical protein
MTPITVCRAAGEPPPPEPLAEDDYVLTPGLVLVRQERAAEQGASAEHGKEIRGPADHAQPLGLRDVAQISASWVVRREIIENAVVGPEVEVVRNRYGPWAAHALEEGGLVDANQARRLPIGK